VDSLGFCCDPGLSTGPGKLSGEHQGIPEQGERENDRVSAVLDPVGRFNVRGVCVKGNQLANDRRMGLNPRDSSAGCRIE